MKRQYLIGVLLLPLTAGCVPQPQVNIVEATATPEPTDAVTPEPVAALSFVDSGQRLGEGRSWDVALGDLDDDGDLDAYPDCSPCTPTTAVVSGQSTR